MHCVYGASTTHHDTKCIVSVSPLCPLKNLLLDPSPPGHLPMGLTKFTANRTHGPNTCARSRIACGKTLIAHLIQCEMSCITCPCRFAPCHWPAKLQNTKVCLIAITVHAHETAFIQILANHDLRVHSCRSARAVIAPCSGTVVVAFYRGPSASLLL